LAYSEQTKFPSGGYKCGPYNFAMRNDVHAKAYLASRIDIEAEQVTWLETSKDLHAQSISVLERKCILDSLKADWSTWRST